MRRALYCGSVFKCSGLSVEFLVVLSWFFCPSLFFPLPLLMQCDRCPDDCAWGLMAGLRRLSAMRVCYCLGAGWSQWGPWTSRAPFFHSAWDTTILRMINLISVNLLFQLAPLISGVILLYRSRQGVRIQLASIHCPDVKLLCVTAYGTVGLSYGNSAVSTNVFYKKTNYHTLKSRKRV